MKFDYTKTVDGQMSNPIIPANRYKVEVIKVNDQYPTSKGYEQWIIKLKVIEGEYTGSQVDDFNIFSPGLDAANKAMLMEFGFPVDEEVCDIEPIDLIGRKVFANIYIDTYNGVDRNKVERFGGYESLMKEAPKERPTPKVDDMSDIPF